MGNIISVGDEHFRCPEVQFFTRFRDEKASEICDTIFLSITGRLFRGDSGCFVPICYETHEGLWDKAHRGRTAQPMFGMFNEPAIPVAIQAHRERMKQPMLVMFNVLAAPVATQADWYLSALRRAAGIVTDSCDNVSHSSHVCSEKVRVVSKGNDDEHLGVGGGGILHCTEGHRNGLL